MADSPNNTAPPRLRPRFSIRTIILLTLVFFVLSPLIRNPGGCIAQWKLALARHQVETKQPDAAVQTIDSARRWDPSNREVLSFRVRLLGNPVEAVNELTAALQTIPQQSLRRIPLLNWRSNYLQQLGRHEEAIADANAMVELARTPEGAGLGQPYDLINLLNSRAYIIARAADAGWPISDDVKGDALLDMQAVMARLNQQQPLAGSSAYVKLQLWMTEAMYLDTYAYLRLHVDSDQSNAELALRDLNRALELCDLMLALWPGYAGDGLELAGLDNFEERLVENKAVILHHRGEALKELGNEAGYIRDVRAARAMGYSKERGIW